MPYPKSKESKSKFISRAIEQFMTVEKIPQKEAIGRAYWFWQSYHKKRGK